MTSAGQSQTPRQKHTRRESTGQATPRKQGKMLKGSWPMKSNTLGIQRRWTCPWPYTHLDTDLAFDWDFEWDRDKDLPLPLGERDLACGERERDLDFDRSRDLLRQWNKKPTLVQDTPKLPRPIALAQVDPSLFRIRGGNRMHPHLARRYDYV